MVIPSFKRLRPVLVGFGYSGGWGLGYENYTVSVEDVAVMLNAEVEYTFFDAFLLFDLYGLTWQVGGGLGNATMSPFSDSLGNTFAVEEAGASQFLLTGAYAISPSFALSLGFRSISADSGILKVNGIITGSVYDLSGRAWGVGLQLVF